MSEQAVLNKRIADRLLEERRIDQSEHQRILDYGRRTGMRAEECILELEIMEESVLLKFIATLHKTQFVSSERLAKARIDKNALGCVGKEMAKHFGVYPLVLDRVNDKLIVATADPDNPIAPKELSIKAQVPNVLMMVARPAAVEAAIERGYEGRRRLFKKLLANSSRKKVSAMIHQDPFYSSDRRDGESRPRRGSKSSRSRDSSRTGRGEEPRQRSRTGRDTDDQVRRAMEAEERRRKTGRTEVFQERRRATGRATGRTTGRSRPGRTGRPLRSQHVTEDPMTGEFELLRSRTGEPSWSDAPPAGRGGLGVDPDLLDERSSRGSSSGPPHSDPAPEAQPGPKLPAGIQNALLDDGAVVDPLAGQQLPEHRLQPVSSMHMPRSRFGFGAEEESQASADDVSPEDITRSAPFLEMMRVMSGLLENERDDLRGHSMLVARLMHTMCDRLELPPEQTKALVLAGYIHDFGKMGELHLTAFNVSQYDEHNEAAAKLVSLPEQLLESVGLPAEALEAVGSMYEQIGGNGFPMGLAGHDIPLGSRILAAADTYADLTHNSNNPYRRLLSPDEAVAVLEEAAGTVFDASVVQLFEKATGGEKILTELMADRHRILIVDPDPEETMVLQLRLVEAGYEVHLARTVDEARVACEARNYSMVVSEIDIDEESAGFHLREEIKETHPDTGWVFLSGRNNRSTAQRAFDLDVDDFIAKPVSSEIVAAKLGMLLERRAERMQPKGVSGSLAEMSLPDIIQVLWHGQKTCKLNVSLGDTKGEVHFDSGQIINAVWGGLVGEEAFYEMLGLSEEGLFNVDPTFEPGHRAIQMSPEGLLLEGMRILDERRREQDEA